MDLVLAQSSYVEFKRALAASDCRRCALSQSRTHLVVDRGSPNARVLVIGEAPGKNEDLQQRAFVGMAGKSFDRMNAEIGIDTEKDFLICNTVKCRPPENRRPKPQETAACRAYLLRQVELVAPRLIVLMGATALQSLDPARAKFSMQAEAGKFFKLSFGATYDALTLYHPAALIYNRSLNETMRAHLLLLKQFMQREQLFNKI